MKQGAYGFVPARLVEARDARGLSGVQLADLIGITRSAISLYETGRSLPRPDVAERMALVLNLPLAFFFTPYEEEEESSIVFFRALSSATKGQRLRAERRLVWLRNIVEYLEGWVEFPSVTFPDYLTTAKPFELNDNDIEELAEECRKHWNLGDDPVPNLVLLLENNGAVVSRGVTDSERLNSFSRWSAAIDRPIVYLGSDKNVAVLSRFDAAHELAHLILHRHIPLVEFRDPATHAQMERQAHAFAGAFLLPRGPFLDELWGTTLNAFRALKSRWKVSIGAMIKRSSQLGLLSEKSERGLWINYNRRRWAKGEPLDDVLEPEQPVFLRRSFELIIREAGVLPDKIAQDLPYARTDIENLAGLPSGMLSGDTGNVIHMPSLRLSSPPDDGGMNRGALIQFPTRKSE